MAATPSSNPKPPGDERNPAVESYVTSFEDNLHEFWQKNRTIVVGLIAFVFLAIVGKGLWEWNQRESERKLQASYAAANTPDQLRAFAAANGDHPLAGIAYLRIADEAYAAGKSAEAIEGYDKAAAILEKQPLAPRARLGRALAKVQAGKSAEAVTELKALADDSAQLKALRAEAAYHLASLAADSGNSADVQKYIEQLNQIDPASMWSRRAMALQATLPAPAAPAVQPAAPAAQKDASGPSIKLPGK